MVQLKEKVPPGVVCLLKKIVDLLLDASSHAGSSVFSFLNILFIIII